MQVSRTVIFSHEGTLEDYLSACQDDVLWEIIPKYVPAGARVLEAGAGSGKWLAFLSMHGYRMVGIELNENSVRRFREKYPAIQYDIGDVTTLPYPDGYFDAALSLGVIEHFLDGADPALREMHRVLSDRGIAIISVPVANLIWQIEKFKDMIFYPMLGSDLIRKLLRRRPTAYSVEDQAQYVRQLSRRLIRGLSYKRRFSPVDGITFYEYRFRIRQLLQIVSRNGFSPVFVHLGYSEQRLYQLFGSIVGRYAPGKGVALNPVAAFLRKFIPNSWIAHMILLVASKSHGNSG